MNKFICYILATSGGALITAMVLAAIQYGSIITVGL